MVVVIVLAAAERRVVGANIMLESACSTLRRPVVQRTTFIFKYKVTLRKTSHNPSAEHLEQQGYNLTAKHLEQRGTLQVSAGV